jgi:glycosyltransferase involved in cell wall biosynthesis
VIGAYRRDTYLRDAVRSVLAQTLPRDRYEVFVLKGFEDPDLDRFLNENVIPSLLDADPCIGSWLLRAVRATRAPLLAFLDDDDEFEPERLADVIRCFDEHPEVGFYRNRVRVIDRHGAPVPTDRWRDIETDAEFDRLGPVLVSPEGKQSLVDLAYRRTRASFNSSTMVVRRSLLEGVYAERFSRLQLPDLAFLVFASVGPFGLYLDDRRLTRYRVYGGNVTTRISWLAHATFAHRDLAAFARAAHRDELADWLDRMADHYERMYVGGRVVEAVEAREARRDVAALAAEYLRFLGRHPVEWAPTLDVWASAIYGAGYVLAPDLAQRVLAKRPTAGAR